MSDEDNLNQLICVDVKEVVQDRQLPAVLRVLAQDIMAVTYIKPGHWLRDLTDPDIAILSLMVQSPGSDKYAVRVIGLIAVLLGQAEGITGVDNSTANQMGKMMCELIIAESVARIAPESVQLKYDDITFEDLSVSIGDWVAQADDPPTPPLT